MRLQMLRQISPSPKKVFPQFGCLFLCALILATRFAFAGPSDENEWLTCEKNADCTSVTVGCYRWAPVNKQFAAEMKQEGMVSCKKSVDPGPQPTTSCVNHLCVNDPSYVPDETTAIAIAKAVLRPLVGGDRVDGPRALPFYASSGASPYNNMWNVENAPPARNKWTTPIIRV